MFCVQTFKGNFVNEDIVRANFVHRGYCSSKFYPGEILSGQSLFKDDFVWGTLFWRISSCHSNEITMSSVINFALILQLSNSEFHTDEGLMATNLYQWPLQ